MAKVTYRLGELYSGPGGLAVGALAAKVRNGSDFLSIEHAWANDIDPDSCATYVRNVCPSNPESVICQPVQDLDIESLCADHPIDCFAYGFPCNDFSIVGERKGFNGQYGPLYSYGIRVLNFANPKWFIAENVSGLQGANGGGAFEKILKDLSTAGYGYRLSAHLYKFEEYGVPQCRHRIIIVGFRNDLGLNFRVPAPTTAGFPVSAGSAILNPPILPNASNHELTRQSRDAEERLRYIPAGENAWYEGIPERLRLNVKSVRLSQIYKRLMKDAPSYTVTGSGGGGTHVYHWEEPRALTNRERARLQTFPDSHIFCGTKESVRKQIGMAVPPLGAKIIVEAILKTIAGVSYPTVPPRWNLNWLNQRDFVQLGAIPR